MKPGTVKFRVNEVLKFIRKHKVDEDELIAETMLLFSVARRTAREYISVAKLMLKKENAT